MVLNWAILIVLLGTVTANGDSGGAGECKHTDKNKNCAYWRDNKYCTDTEWESWMEENCAKSCKCEESEQWSGIQTKIWGDDQCKNIGNFGNLNFQLKDCQKKCLQTATCTAINYNKNSKGCVLRGCSQPVQPPQWQHGDDRGYYIMDQNGSSCVDKHTSCAAWSSRGECTNYPGYMNINCAKSCDKCGGTGATKTLESSCVDKHTSCAAWSARGECTKNPGYMNINCAKSCDKCRGTGGTGTTVTTRPVVVTGNNKFGCIDGVKAYPHDLPNPDFYRKICYSAQGIKIISSNQVSDAALERTAFLIDHVMQKVDPRVSKMMNSNKLRYAVIAAYPKEEIKTLPEFSYLRFWTARGAGATMHNPLGSSAVENIMCHKNDGLKGQDITIHEFAHSLQHTGLARVFPGFQRELEGLFSAQRRAGLWRNTYANTNEMEYFAEGVQSYFNANNQIIPGVNEGITRYQLRLKDPNLYKFLDRYLGRNYWKWSCP